MKFQDHQTFDVPVEVLRALYLNPDYYQKKYDLLGMRDLELVSNQQDAQTSEFAYRMSLMPTNKLPKLAEKFIDPNKPIMVLRTARWDLKSNQGELTIEVLQTKRVRLGALMVLESTDSGCVNKQNWTITIDVPLIGEKLANLLAEDIRGKTRADEAVTRQLLADLNSAS